MDERGVPSLSVAFVGFLPFIGMESVKAQPSKYNGTTLSLWEFVEAVTLTRQIKKPEYNFGSRNSAEVQLQKLVPRIK